MQGMSTNEEVLLVGSMLGPIQFIDQGNEYSRSLQVATSLEASGTITFIQGVRDYLFSGSLLASTRTGNF